MLLGMVLCSFPKVLLTGREFLDGASRAGFEATMNNLLNMRMIPILNNNDVVTPTEAEKKVCMCVGVG